jgi:hypothetical protein
MNAQSLLHELMGIGVSIRAVDGELHIDAPTGAITPERITAIRALKPQLLALVAAPVAIAPASASCPSPRAPRNRGGDRPSWPIALVPWLAAMTPADLPPAPFTLHPGITVSGPVFLAQLQADAVIGPSHPRARWGALQADICALATLLKGATK